jgi:hypothetical protein
MVMVSVPETVLGAPLAPPVAKNVAWYVPLSAVTGVSVIAHSSSYSSDVPLPDVAVVQAGELERDVASFASLGKLPEFRVMEAG